MHGPQGALGLTREQTAAVIATAGLTPSLHNTQPWRFRVDPRGIAVLADPARRLPVADPTGRELRLACGAALYTLRLALHGCGIRPLVTVLPDTAEPELIAVVRDGGHRSATPEERRLLDAVPRRRTNRHPFTGARVGLAEEHALRRAAQDEGCWLHVVADPARRRQLRELAAGAHREQVADPAFRAELARWTTTDPARTDGVPAAAGGPLPAGDGWLHRDFSGGTAPPRPADRGTEPEPVIAVRISHLTGATGDVQAGQALQKVLLTATADGLAVSFLSQVVEVPRTRELVRHLVRAQRPPQAVLRIGRGHPVVATPRRPVADLVVPGAPVTAEPPG